MLRTQSQLTQRSATYDSQDDIMTDCEKSASRSLKIYLSAEGGFIRGCMHFQFSRIVTNALETLAKPNSLLMETNAT